MEPDGRVKWDRRWVPIDAESYVNGHLQAPIEPSIAVICNSRLAATSGTREHDEIRDILKFYGLDYEMVDSMLAVHRPDTLDRYDAVFCSTKYLDTDILDAIAIANKKTMFFGQFERDINARAASYRLDSELQQNFYLSCNEANQSANAIPVGKALFFFEDLVETNSSHRTLVSDFLDGEYVNVDLNRDGDLNILDFAIFAAHWANAKADMSDFATFASHWLE